MGKGKAVAAQPDSVTFASAIDTIETLGWTNLPSSGDGVCIWQAVVRNIPTQPGNGSWDAFDEEILRLQKVVTNHFGVTKIGEVFYKNDRIHDRTLGREWAVMHLSHLRDAAKCDEEANRPKFFARLWNAISGKW